MSDEKQRRMHMRHLLATSPVVETRTEGAGTRCSSAIQVVTLAGGVEAFWKRGDIDPPGIAGVRREVAAYDLLLLLGWEDLAQVVGHRREPVVGGGSAEVASIELLPDGDDGLAVTAFEQDSIERAAAFDALIANSDRMGHNWRGIATPGGPLLKLYDHELAFGLVNHVSSSFWTHIGQNVPARIKVLLGAALDDITGSTVLQDLLSEAEFRALVQRMREMTL